MNRFFTLLLAASCLTAVGQVTYPYNPDGNADGDIDVGDLQDFLVTYGNPFSPSEIMVGDSTLTSWVVGLEDLLSSQQNSIDSIVSSNAISLALTRHSFNWHQPDGISNLSLVHASHNAGPIEIPEGKSLYLFQAEGTYEITLRNGESYLHQIELGGFENHPIEPTNQTAYFIGDVASFEFNAGDPTELIRGFVVDSKVDKAFLNLENGPYTVPDGMMLVVLRAFECISDPFCANDIALNGQVLSFTINADGPNRPKGYRSQIFESGEVLSGGVRLDGYLIDFASLNSTYANEEEDNLGPCQGEFTVNYHGYDYELVEIGDQCWFAENLQTTTYNNGDSIPYAILGGTGYFEWQLDPSRFDDFCLYDGFTGAGQFDTKSPLMRSWIGLAYSGYAAMNEALCPIGFRVPTTQDFEVLLGVPANVSVLRGDLLDSPPWGFGSNLSGFSARMHGSVGHDNTCYESGVEAKLLTSDVGWVQNDGTPHMNHLVIRGNGYADVSSGSFFSAWGRGGAIRCIKDTE